MPENIPAFVLQDITKTFPEVIANDKVSLSVNKTVIHAIVGENGAGKSTLMKVLVGIYQPDSGLIIVEGQKRKFKSPLDAFNCGIYMVHQDLMLINSLSVLENIILGFEQKKAFGFLNITDSVEKIERLKKKYKIEVSLDKKVGSLPVVIQQRVEILKALYRNIRILILDEPTSILAPQEIESFFKALRTLKKMGTTIVLITHKLNEVFQIADHITVMRSGKLQGTLPVSKATEDILIRMMVGRRAILKVNKIDKTIDKSKPILSINKINLVEKYPLIKNVTFSIYKGEVVGIAGVAGNGQTELAEVITGLRKPNSGEIVILDKLYTSLTTKAFRKVSSFVPQDRRNLGSSSKQSVWENIIISLHKKNRFSTIGFIRKREILNYGHEVIKNYDVKTPSLNSLAGDLSGGNLQKLILGRELSKKPALLVAEDPTRGLDVVSTKYTRKQILRFAAEGNSVLLFSQDLEEVIMLSDRILVIFKGEIVGEFSANEVSSEVIGLYMMGLKKKISG